LELLGRKFGELCSYNDVILLHGDVGVGKTCFVRGFIKTLLKHTSYATSSITSPTYLLDNTYTVEGTSVQHGYLNRYGTPDAENGTIHHMDLYRLKQPSDTEISNSYELLNIPHIYAKPHSICLIEWPARLLMPNENFNMNRSELINTRSLLPSKYINVYIRIADEPDGYLQRHTESLVPAKSAKIDVKLDEQEEEEERREVFISVSPNYDSVRFDEMIQLYRS